MEDSGRFSVIVRLLLTADQRGRLFELCHREQIDVSDALTTIVGDYRDRRPDLQPPPTTPENKEKDQEAIRWQLRRLRMQAKNLGENAPSWLSGYIADLETELKDQ